MGWWKPYFFKNDAGQKVTVNGDRYRAVINGFLVPGAMNWHSRSSDFLLWKR